MPHAHVPYPDFSLECVTELVRIVRARAVPEERKAFAKHCWMVISAGLKLVIGEPDNGPILAGQESAALESASTEQLTECREALAAAKGEVQSFGAVDVEAGAIDPALILMLIDLAYKIIKEIIDRRKPK